MNEQILQYKGCLPDVPDARDYNALELMGDLGEAPSFREGYSVRENGKEYEYLGAYETIEELDYEVRDRNFKIYSKDEYKLELVRK